MPNPVPDIVEYDSSTVAAKLQGKTVKLVEFDVIGDPSSMTLTMGDGSRLDIIGFACNDDDGGLGFFEG